MRTTAVPILVLALSAPLGLAQISIDPAWSSAEHEIWALEGQYMKKLKEGDLDGLSMFWHEDFIGWPSHAAEPVDRSESRASAENLLHNLMIVELEAG